MIKKLTDRVYYMPHKEDTDRPSLGVICGNKYSLVVDSGNSPKHANEFLMELDTLDIPPLKYLAITHYHWDHIFGIKEMGLVTIANHNTIEKLEEIKKYKWDDVSLVEHVNEGRFSDFTIECIKKEITDRDNFEIGELDITYENSIKIDLGGLTCIIKSIGGDHTSDASMIYIPEEKVLFLGDCIYGGMYKGVYGYTREKLFPMIDEIHNCDAEHYIVSHENIFNKDGITDLLNQLKIAGELVGEDLSSEEAIKRFSDKYNRVPSEDESFYMKCFADVNRVMLNQ